MEKKYYNKAYINEVAQKCFDFANIYINMQELAELLTYQNLDYYCTNQDIISDTYILCIDGNYAFKNGTKKQFIAAFILASKTYRTKTIKEVDNFIQSIK